MHLGGGGGGVECHVHPWVIVTLTLISDLVSRMWYISPILFEVGIPNLVRGCILGWQSVMYQFFGHCDLDLVSRIIVSGAYLLYHLRQDSQIWCMDASLDGICRVPFLGHCDLDI